MMSKARRLRLWPGLGLSLAILLTHTAVAEDAAQVLGEPDLAAIQQAAQRVDPARDYVQRLPDRAAECQAAARPYIKTHTTQGLVIAEVIWSACLKGMLIRMAEVHYDADVFGEGGMSALTERLEDDLARLYYGIYQHQRDCNYCGTMYAMAPRGEVNAVLENAVMTIATAQFRDGSDAYRDWQARWSEVVSK